jgi:hypothetical protein
VRSVFPFLVRRRTSAGQLVLPLSFGFFELGLLIALLLLRVQCLARLSNSQVFLSFRPGQVASGQSEPSMFLLVVVFHGQPAQNVTPRSEFLFCTFSFGSGSKLANLTASFIKLQVSI